jgi:hypothetical protein
MNAFANRLARLETRGRGRGPEQQAAILDEPIGDPKTQRKFRPDDREIDLLSLGQRAGPLGIRQIDAGGTGQPGDTGISGRRDNLTAVAFRGEPGDQCVLARAAAEDKNSH